MRRLWLPLLIVVFLAACSSTPQKTSHSGSSGSSANAWRTKPPGFPNFVDHSVGREEISIQAMSLVGIPYRWGGNTPDSGFDCSGLVKYVFARSAQVDLPRTTADISQRGEAIDPDEIAAGDLVFFNTTGRPHSHVGIYVGKLRFVNAPSTGGTVRLDYLTNPYWAKHFDGIRRMAPAKRAPTTPFDTPTWEAATPAPAAQAAAVAAAAPALGPAPAAPSASRTNATATAMAPAATPPAPRVAMVDQSRLTSTPQPAYAGSAAPADAFEPPPPGMSAAARQAAQAGSTPIEPASSSDAPAQIMRASTTGGSVPAPTQSSDDPIARFATGSF
ncbi:C40 family peptidase [Paraburkholderia sacchari]|uniref:C40 family peptidase n=1 Tax=Paraburkholderia sacchari TaxID=159450 RepID=UPI000542A714|nr:C40 family peptidase [Paraburkholderia sacchari]NLP64060.1 C40 family peptidase [Paraburkholderia sacchari]